MSDINGDVRSPSVSSNDSKSSLGSTKKVSQLQKFKEQFRNVKQKFKSNKVACSPHRASPSTKVVNSEDETQVPRDSSGNDVATSPHVDHSYVTRNANSSSFRNKSAGNNLFNVNGDPISASIQTNGWSERPSDSPESNFNHNQQQKGVQSQPICVSRKGLSVYGQYGATMANDSTHSLDVLDRLNQQNVTKSWNGNHANSSLDTSSKYFTQASNNNNNYDYSHGKARHYDEFDSEIDRGHSRKRKSHEGYNASYNQSYGHSYGYQNGGTGHYKGHNNNNYSYDNSGHRNVNKFQQYQNNRSNGYPFSGGFSGNNRMFRGRGTANQYR